MEMKHKRYILEILVISILVIVMSACAQTSTTNQPNPQQPEQPIQPSTPVNLTVDAGADQEHTVGDLVVLDGSKSTEEANYSWKLIQKPAGSTVVLNRSFGASTSFRPDVMGTYVAELTLKSGKTTESVQVNIMASEFIGTGIIAANNPITAQNGVLLTPPNDVNTTDVQIRTIDKLAIPLPSIYKAIGNSYSLKSKTLVKSVSNKTIKVSLPVPASAPHDKLALAVLVPAEHQYGLLLNKGGFQDSWFVIDSQISEDKFQAVSDLFMLLPDELQLTLVTHPELNRNNEALRTLSVTTPNFFVACDITFLTSDIPCRQIDETIAAATFETIFLELKDKGFTNNPAIRKTPFSGKNIINLVPPHPFGWAGQYVPVIGSLAIVSDGNFGSTGALSEVVTSRHEYFHALQFSYLNPIQVAEVAFNLWSLEGQAMAIMNSRSDVQRFAESLLPRDVEVGFFDNTIDVAASNLPPYEAQDFWVFVAKSINNSTSSLERFVSQGHSASSVDSVFRNSNSVFPSLGEAYWAWVKNQAFEANIEVVIPSENCTPNRGITGTVNPLGTVQPTFISFAPSVNENGAGTTNISRSVRLDPLSSKLFTIDLRNDSPANYVSYQALIQLQDTGNDVKFKIYDDASYAQQPCTELPDGRRNIQVHRLNEDGGPNRGRIVHVLISNTSHTSSVEPILIIDSNVEPLSNEAAALRLIQPTFTRVREGKRVTYEVEAVSPNVDSRLAWFINNERVREDEVPRGSDNYKLSFVPCPQETTMRAALLERLAGNQIVTHTMEVVPFGEPIVDTNQDGWYVGIATEEEIFRARIRLATCNDPDSTSINLQDVLWKIDSRDKTIDEVLKFAKEQLKGDKIFAEIGLQYPAKDPNGVETQFTVYACEARNDLSEKSSVLPCLAYQNQKATEDMFRGLELLNTQKEAIDFLQSRLTSGLNSSSIKTSALTTPRKESLDKIASIFSKDTASVLDTLFSTLESKDIGTFETSFKELHLKIQKGGFKQAQSDLILEAMGLVMTQVDEYSNRSSGGNNRWAQFMFSKDPDGINQKVNVLEPANRALEAFVSVVATTEQVKGLDEIMTYVAALHAVEISD